MIEPHRTMPPPGTLIRMTRTYSPYYRIGDMAVMMKADWANFSGQGNPVVFEDGVWSVRDGHFLIVKEASK